MKYHQQTVVFLYFFFFLPFFSFPQKTQGIPFIRNYSPKEYSASTNNWAIAQDQRGVMYFGNSEGILEFDGVKWTTIPVQNNSIVRSIAIDKNGIIYVGAVGEFGFLEANEKGILSYHSLLNKLPANERTFADVWKTYVTPEGVYFQSFTKLILLKDDAIKIWKPESSFHFSFLLNDQLFINDREKGLKHLVNDKLVFVKGGAFFKGMRIYAMLDYPNNKILVATREKGLFLINNKDISTDSSIVHLECNVNEHLIDDLVYGGASISNNRFAFATLTNGIIVTDLSGNIIQTFNKQIGLQDEIINNIFLDHQGDLWIALGNGISRTEISSPLSFINDAQGISGSIQDIVKTNGALYLTTSSGTFVSNVNHFIPVNGINTHTWSLLKFINQKDTFLLVSSETGIFKIEKDHAYKIQDGFAYFLCQSKKNPERVFIGLNDGLSSMRYENKHWISEDYLKGIDKEIRSIVEDSEANLWLGTPYEGLIKVDFIKGDQSSKGNAASSRNDNYKLHTYDTTSGLPDMRYNIPYNFHNKIVFATYKGLYEFDETNNKFFPSPLLAKEIQQDQVYRFVQKDSTTIWLFTVAANEKKTGVAYLKSDNSYSWYSKPFGKISEREIHAIYPDENGITWLGGPDGLLRYDANVKKDFSQHFFALIRKVTIGKDSIIFGGSFYKKQDNTNIPVDEQLEFLKPSIDFGFNSISFEYSATSFGDEQNNLFSVFLEGFDNDWSGWSNKNLKEYTNLKEGNYIFHLKSKNIYGTESIQSTYAFTVLPPWYRTIWAYIVYVIAFILFIYFIIQLSISRLKKSKILLEETVQERTSEVVKQKLVIESKNKDITDSINYAQRIQRALLASDTLLKENLSSPHGGGYFIFFQPKDIVSGDFYWASKLTNGQFALVTADSTGHGVPGAIMSMLNISCLNEAINGQKLNEPSDILNYTRSKIIAHLANDGSAEGGKDGMDCSLVNFDLKNKQLTYSSANNPVWIARDKNILEFAPDKMPVGKHDKDSVSFSQHTISLEKDDVVYTLTDGMPDQFGGPKGKKFMYKQLKDLLKNICHLPMDEQKEKLKTSLNEWKGDLDQVDDICLIGIKI